MSAFWALAIFMSALIGIVLIFLVAGRVREKEARRTAFFDSEGELDSEGDGR